MVYFGAISLNLCWSRNLAYVELKALPAAGALSPFFVESVCLGRSRYTEVGSSLGEFSTGISRCA